jgi:hypothetical protein
MGRTRIVVLACAVLASVVLTASPASAQTTVLRATLTGAEAIPSGDPDGTGQAYVVIDDRTNRVCVVVWVRDIAPATGAHIHVGAAGQTGGHALDLNPPVNGVSVSCSIVSESTVQQFLTNPGGFYVNIHNAEFHAGALRGQLATLA